MEVNERLPPSAFKASSMGFVSTVTVQVASKPFAVIAVMVAVPSATP